MCVCLCVGVYVWVCVQVSACIHVLLMSVSGRRGCQSLWNQNRSWLWTPPSALGTKPRSSAGAPSVLHRWAFSSVPTARIFLTSNFLQVEAINLQCFKMTQSVLFYNTDRIQRAHFVSSKSIAFSFAHNRHTHSILFMRYVPYVPPKSLRAIGEVFKISN